MTAKIANLTSRALISVKGADWRSFLQGLITQDVETLKPGEMRYGALLTPQGRLLHDLFIFGEDDGYVLDVAGTARDAIIDKLTLYRLRAKVKIESSEAQVFACWGDGSPSDGTAWVADPRTPRLGFRAFSATASNLDATTEAAYDAHRLALGVADPVKDCAENDYPIEANLDLLNGIDFKKGCFVGQETTSRMHRRGLVKTRMAPIRFDSPAPRFGAPILAGDLRAGEVRGAQDGRAIALLRIDRTGGALTCESRRVVLDLPSWLEAAFHLAVDEKPQ